MTAHESGDDRDDCVDCDCAECRGGQEEEWRRPFGPSYVDTLGSVSDAVVPPDLLDRVLTLDDRWPEPRALDQDRVFYLRDRTAVFLSALGPDGAARLLEHLHDIAEQLHDAAVCDEESTTSTALRWAMEQAGVPSVADLDAAVWLESSVLVRALRARADRTGGGPVPRPGGP